MKVRELITELSALDLDAEVILQKDAEGSGYSPLEGVDDSTIYVPESAWAGSIYSILWTNEEVNMEGIKDKPRCVVLYPVSKKINRSKYD